jgi:hypothetical protein
MLFNGGATADGIRNVAKVDFLDVFVPFSRESVRFETTIDVEVPKRIMVYETFRDIRFPNSRWPEDKNDRLQGRYGSFLANEPVEKVLLTSETDVFGGLLTLPKHEIVDCGAFYEVTFFCISPKNLLGYFFYSLNDQAKGRDGFMPLPS